ncbi:carbohydrate kinase family protein [Streptomyces sp. IBSBF 2953]|uniref:carbohydrate kinase family protein n=1 Tax=Streptomyces TaxID=1883 RepID=UPI00211A707A|nr:carbohydrate kinase family protein [Streptomyces scabiei]MCQ9182183.1 carbohydrate kinase family protein [Streptomyces hayashii]MDX3117316.1 carbohydrate kinase family protein [Streptomyces scabiei]
MRIAVTGSIATDHLMTFPGRFSEQLLSDSLEHVSLSFLADRLDVRRGGVGANIAFGLGRLGLRPVLVGAAGLDFTEYDGLLRAAGVDTAWVRVSDTLHTARFVCTTDDDQNQIATFYAGAMAEARAISLAEVGRGCGGLDLVLVGADDPQAMLRHTRIAHDLDVAVAADPSQQLARLDGRQARALVDGARWLFTNEYESALLLERTGWSAREVLRRVGVWVTTRGAEGVTIDSARTTTVDVPAVPAGAGGEPTGAGDAFRAGFLAGIARELTCESAARLGCALATLALESVGTQEYKLVGAELVSRIDRAYGRAAARSVEPLLAGVA